MEKGRFWVYVLELGDGRRYVGQTNNLARRMAEHRSGRSRFTRKYKIVRLLYSEECETRSAALKREKFLKSGKGREWLKAQLAEQSASGG